jgi:hypothetical protein
MTVRKKILLGAIALLLMALLAVFFTQTGCEATGGRWGAAVGHCTTRLCHYSGACGYWVHPHVRCNSVRAGTSFAEVHFLFGDSFERQGDRVRWRFGKPFPVSFDATFRDERLVSLQCPEGW